MIKKYLCTALLILIALVTLELSWLLVKLSIDIIMFILNPFTILSIISIIITIIFYFKRNKK